MRWMSRRKALAITKVGLLVCLAMNFRKTQTSARFVAMAIPKIRMSFGGEMPAGVGGLYRRAVPWCRRVRLALCRRE